MTKTGKGWGLFATRPIKKDTMLIVEKPIAYIELKYFDKNLDDFYIEEDTYDDCSRKLIKKCEALCTLKGTENVRLSHLYYGQSRNLKIPDLDIFIDNTYKQYDIEPLNENRLTNIINKNHLKFII